MANFKPIESLGLVGEGWNASVFAAFDRLAPKGQFGALDNYSRHRNAVLLNLITCWHSLSFQSEKIAIGERRLRVAEDALELWKTWEASALAFAKGETTPNVGQSQASLMLAEKHMRKNSEDWRDGIAFWYREMIDHMERAVEMAKHEVSMHQQHKPAVGGRNQNTAIISCVASVLEQVKALYLASDSEKRPIVSGNSPASLETFFQDVLSCICTDLPSGDTLVRRYIRPAMKQVWDSSS